MLNNYGAFEEALVRNFCRQILTGLNYLHEREIIHRDIKGANILVDNKGGIKISDFGISKKVENSQFTLPLGTRSHGLQLTCRPDDWNAGEPTLFARIRLLDGPRDCETDELHFKSGYLECRVSRRGDVDRNAPLGRAHSDASDLPGGSDFPFGRSSATHCLKYG